MSSQNDILQLGLSFWKMIGEYMHYSSKKLQFWRIFNVAIFSIAIWFTVANLGHTVGVGYMKTIEGISTLVHASDLTFLNIFLYNYYNYFRSY